MLSDRELKLRDGVLNILKYEGNVKSDSLNFLAKQISSQKLELTDAIAKSIDNAMVVVESCKFTKEQQRKDPVELCKTFSTRYIL